MYTTIISHTCEANGIATFGDRPTFHGRRIQTLEVQFLVACHPSYRKGITYENLELIELIFKMSFLIKNRKV